MENEIAIRLECHGTIHRLQCVEACTDATLSANDFLPAVDETTCLLEHEMPRCPHCGGLARPSILMSGDWQWVEKHAERQEKQLASWFKRGQRLVVVEVGTCQAIPTVRRFSERHGPRVIRINPRESTIPIAVGVGMACAARDALQQIDIQFHR